MARSDGLPYYQANRDAMLAATSPPAGATRGAPGPGVTSGAGSQGTAAPFLIGHAGTDGRASQLPGHPRFGQTTVGDQYGDVPANDIPPVIEWRPYAEQRGEALNCTLGIWQGEPSHYEFQWRRDGAPVGTDSPDLQLTGNDAGHLFFCQLTAGNGFGVAVTVSNTVTASADLASAPADLVIPARP